MEEEDGGWWQSAMIVAMNDAKDWGGPFGPQRVLE